MEPQPVTPAASERRLPTWLRTVIVGSLLGAGMALLGSALMLPVLDVYFWLTIPNLRESTTGIPLITRAFCEELIPIMAFFSVPLGMVGGVFVALALRERAQHGWLSQRFNLAIGVGVGAASAVPLTLLELFILSLKLFRMPIGDIMAVGAFTMGIATLAGGVHAWLIDRWLRQHGATQSAPVR